MPNHQTKTIEYKLLSQLFFDPNNPRLPKSVNGSDEKEVINWMLENENLTELMASIAEKGFFAAEPLLVVKRSNEDNFEVVEGNRRLTAVKLLLNPELATSRKSTITDIVQEAKALSDLSELPVIVFDKESELQIYLGYRHITGIQPWDSLAKARYLKKLKESLGNDDSEEMYKSLAKTIGSRTDHVKLLLAGYDIYEIIEKNDFFRIKDLDERSIKFGVLYTAINNPNIATFIGVDLEQNKPVSNVKADELNELTRWMFEKPDGRNTRLGESRNLRLLNKIVADEKALEAFRNNKTLQDAVLLTDEPEEIFRISINEAYSKLQTARDYMHLISNVNPQDQSGLDEIYKLAKTISVTLRAKLMEDTDDE